MTGESKIGRLREALLRLYREHLAQGMIPTSGRFLWYELIDRGVVDKTRARGHPGVKRGVDQDVTAALTQLRESGDVPWDAISDETRAVHDRRGFPTLRTYLRAALEVAHIDPWLPGLAPLILCESRSLAGVLVGLVGEYRCVIAPTNGQCGGFLHNEIAPLVGARRVLYLGDWDHRGGLIEANTRRVLAEYDPALWSDDFWERVALTDVQVRDRRLPVIDKLDRAYKPPRTYPAVETEALGQHIIVGLLRDRLAGLLPQPLADVHVRERAERRALARLLAGEED